MTNKLLFEAVGLHLYERWGNMHYRVNGGSLEDESLEAVLPQLIGVLEQSNNLNYRILTNYNNTAVPSWTYRAAATYVTGLQAIKFGFNRTHGYLDEYQYALNPVSYRFNLGVPNRITERAMPFKLDHQSRQRPRLLRAGPPDAQSVHHSGRPAGSTTSRPASRNRHVGPAPLTPKRNITFPAQDNISWKDLTYRSGVAYDLFGNGTTAVKAAFNKYLLGQTLNGLGRNPNPVLSLRTTANRPWNDRGGLGINGDYIPQCDLLNPLANGECGPIDDQAFGTAVPGDLYDKDLISRLQQPADELGVLDQRAASDPAARGRGRRLLPPRLGPLPGDRQPAARARGLHVVQRRRAIRPASAGRRRLHVDRFL